MKAGNYLYIFTIFFTCHTAVAKAVNDYANLDDIALAAKNYLELMVDKQSSYSSEKHVTVISQAIDSRLKLRKCDKPLTFNHNRNATISGSTSIKVSCHSPYAWAVYTRHHVFIKKTVLVTNKNLPKGHVLTDKDFNFSIKNTEKLRNGYISDKSFALGNQLKRAIREGQPLYNHQLEPIDMVKKGDKVNISAKVGLLTVVTSGTAMDKGKKGDQINVKNQRSSRIVRTRIIGPNAVEVIL